VSKPLDQFSKDKHASDGKNNKCKACKAVIDKQWRQDNNYKGKYDPNYQSQYREQNKEYYQQYREDNKKTYDAQKDYRLKRMYGITKADYDTLLTEQQNKCIICCDEMILPQIDHCHTTGKVRGLLCMHYNTALGKFKDNIDLLQRAIDYLQR
jgi:hypothetical protein